MAVKSTTEERHLSNCKLCACAGSNAGKIWLKCCLVPIKRIINWVTKFYVSLVLLHVKGTTIIINILKILICIKWMSTIPGISSCELLKLENWVMFTIQAHSFGWDQFFFKFLHIEATEGTKFLIRFFPALLFRLPIFNILWNVKFSFKC